MTTPERVTAALRAAGLLPTGAVVGWDEDLDDRAFSRVSRLDLHYDGATSGPASIIRKRTARLTEAQFHEVIQPAAPLPAPTCIAVEHDGDEVELLLEDLAGSHEHLDLDAPIAPARLVETARSLARVHAAWWDHARLDELDGLAPNAQRYVVEEARKGAGSLFDHLRGTLDTTSRATITTALDHAAAAGAAVTDAPGRGGHRTLLHGDAHPANVLFPTTAGAPVLIDWADWRVGAGPADVAFLVVLSCGPRERPPIERDVLAAYHDTLVEEGVDGYGADELGRDYHAALPALAAYPLFWWARGSPGKIWRPALERVLSVLGPG
ncbi:phosphotransferase [soil metagenome]